MVFSGYLQVLLSHLIQVIGKGLSLTACFLLMSINLAQGSEHQHIKQQSAEGQGAAQVQDATQSVAPTHTRTLTFGIVPQQSAAMLVRAWSPLIHYLSQNANLDVRFATAPDIPTFEQRLAQGEYDIAYMNPYHYVVFKQQLNYRALAKESSKQLQGLIVVRKDSDIDSLAKLQGKRLALPAPAAFAASVLPQAHLRQQGVDASIKFVGSHDSVYLAVAKGVMEAGGGVGRTFNNMPATIKQQLKVIWRTPKYTPHAIATHPRVTEQVREQLLVAMAMMPNKSQGQQALEQLNFNPLVPAQDSDWAPIRLLELGSLAQPLSLQDKESR